MIKRRTFIAGLGGVAAWPVVALGAAAGNSGGRVRHQHVGRCLSEPYGCVPPGA
jgi:hypothetical protein